MHPTHQPTHQPNGKTLAIKSQTLCPDVYHMLPHCVWELGTGGLTLWSTRLLLGTDTIWLGNIPLAAALAMFSHALKIMGAMYYLCLKTSERTEGTYCHKASVKSLNMSQLGLQRSDQMGAAQGGGKGYAGQASHNWCQSKPSQVFHWVKSQLDIPSTHPLNEQLVEKSDEV